MPYKVAVYNGDMVAVPQIVFTHLAQADGDTVRVALYVLQTSDTDPRTIARALGLPSMETARRALQYWAGAGLLESGRAEKLVPAEEKSVRIDLASLDDPYVSVLCEEAQTAFGKALSRSEMQRLVGLYLHDGWQPDVILLCCAESARQGRRLPGNWHVGGKTVWNPVRTPSGTCAKSSNGKNGVPMRLPSSVSTLAH